MSYIKFAIISAPRTGSTYLSAKLADHENILSFPEVFNLNRNALDLTDKLLALIKHSGVEALQLRNEDPSRFLSEVIFAEYPGQILAVGLKIMYMQLDRLRPVLQYLLNDRSIRIIHLKRNNILDSYVSLLRAIRTGAWIEMPWNSETRGDDVSIYVKCQNCADYFEEVEKCWKEFYINFRNHKVFELEYDNINSNEVIGELQEFLGVPVCELHASQRKHRKVSHPTLITNYQELRGKFHNTKWEVFFDDE